MKTTEKHALEEEIDRLNDDIRRLKRRERILEAENDDLKTRAAIMCKKTFELLRALNVPTEDIFKYYKETI